MDLLWKAFDGWLHSLFANAIKASLSSILEKLNFKVGSIADEVGRTPQGWNVNIFAMVRNLSQNVIMPVAGVLLTFVACYELIEMVTERNRLHDIDTWILFKWIFKTAVAVFLVAHTFDIVMAVFELSEYLVRQSAGVINTQANLKLTFDALDAQLKAMNTGQLFGLMIEIQFLRLGIHLLSAAVFLIIYGRMLEIYLLCSVGPIPMATMMNREWGDIGKNYLRSLAALGLQGFLMLACVGIYAALVQTLTFGGDIGASVWGAFGYTALLCFALFKTGALSKSIFRVA